MKKGNFDVLPAAEMRARYGFTAENRPAIKLDPMEVPATLRPLIPLAEEFGVSDDLIRQDVVAKTPPDQLEAMRQAVASLDQEFDDWLAGPAAHLPPFSAAYIAFTCLRMAADGCGSLSSSTDLRAIARKQASLDQHFALCNSERMVHL